MDKALLAAIRAKIEEDQIQTAIKISMEDLESPETGGPSTSAGKRRLNDLHEDDKMSAIKKICQVFSADNDDSNNGDDNHDSDRDFDLKQYVVQPEDITTKFEDVHVSPDAIEALETVLLPTQAPTQFKVGILSKYSPTGILLYGPPGTGKTLLLKALAKRADAKVLALSSADIRSHLVSKGEKKIKRIFTYASKQSRPCIIFFDEADSLFRSRSSESNCRGDHDMLNQFLSEMDGISSKGLQNVIVIAATNRPFDIDEGILRRLGRRILIDVPNDDARKEIMKIHLRGETLDDDVNLDELVKVTKDYTGSDIRDLVYTAAIAAVREMNGLQNRKASKRPEGVDDLDDSPRVLRREHFLGAWRQIRPAPKSNTVEKIRDFHNKFGNTSQRAAGAGAKPQTVNITKDVI